MNSITIVLLGLVLLGALIGFYRRHTLRLPVLKLFPYFLLFQFLYQLTASLYSFVFTKHASNHFIFNWALPINILYFGALFYGVVRHPGKRKVIVAGTVLNLLFFLIDLLFIQNISFLMTYPRTTMAMSLVVFALLYFHDLVKSDRQYDTNPARNATFWIVTGIFFFYLSSTLTIIFWTYFVVNNVYFGSVMLRVFAFILYSMYVAGMLLHKPSVNRIMNH
ncbi:hypothetical protein [Parapedobacter sp. 10938]|uniref:hypothetical protein n=1 Tax=Parapedobacter flavus TaxID=3110225 RepID=UPI002DBD1ACE|nr:hypothetical protein [Parapedobacter sp. 10938]MEC3879671.1 hypothetical protein [Parapedobacter sp. 10938]